MPDIVGGPLVASQMNARMRTVWLSGDEDCPPYGAMELIGYTFDGGLRVRKPSADDIPPHLVVFASDLGISAGSSGIGSQKWPAVAYYDDAFSISNREALGTKAGDWRLSKGMEGFLALGNLGGTAKYVVVMPEVVCRNPRRGGYYYGEFPCGTQCCCWRCGANRDTNPFDVSGFNGPTTIRATVTTPCIGSPNTDVVDMALQYCGCNPIPCGAGGPDSDYIGWSGATVDVVSGSCTRCFSTPLPVTWADQTRLLAQLTCSQVTPGSGVRTFTFTWYHFGNSGAVTGQAGLGSVAGSIFQCRPFRAGPFQTLPFTCPALGGPMTTVCLSCVGGRSTILLEAL